MVKIPKSLCTFIFTFCILGVVNTSQAKSAKLSGGLGGFWRVEGGSGFEMNIDLFFRIKNRVHVGVGTAVRFSVFSIPLEGSLGIGRTRASTLDFLALFLTKIKLYEKSHLQLDLVARAGIGIRRFSHNGELLDPLDPNLPPSVYILGGGNYVVVAGTGLEFGVTLLKHFRLSIFYYGSLGINQKVPSADFVNPGKKTSWENSIGGRISTVF